MGAYITVVRLTFPFIGDGDQFYYRVSWWDFFLRNFLNLLVTWIIGNWGLGPVLIPNSWDLKGTITIIRIGKIYWKEG